jgi:hypothetical protein
MADTSTRLRPVLELATGVTSAVAILTALRAACRHLLRRLPWPHGHGQHISPWPAEQDERRASTDVIAAYRAPWPRAPRPEHLAQTMVPAVAEALAPLPRYEDRVTTPDSSAPEPAPSSDGHGPGAEDPGPEPSGQPAGHEPASGPGTLLPVIAADLNGHTSTDDAINSMLHRALTPELLAALDAQKEASNG